MDITMRHKELFVKGMVNEDEKSIVHVITDSTIDRSGEIVDPYTGNVKNYEKNPIVLFGHNYGGTGFGSGAPHIPVIGRSAWLKRDGEQWLSKTMFADATDISRDAWNLAKAGFLPATSIGFMPNGEESVKLADLKDLNPPNKADFASDTSVTVLKNWELFEYSLVSVPANPNALERSFIAKALDMSESQYVKGVLTNALNEKRLTELESIPEKVKEILERVANMDSFMTLLLEDLEERTEKPKSEPEVVETVARLSQDDLKKLVGDVVRGAVSHMKGKVN